MELFPVRDWSLALTHISHWSNDWISSPTGEPDPRHLVNFTRALQQIKTVSDPKNPIGCK